MNKYPVTCSNNNLFNTILDLEYYEEYDISICMNCKNNNRILELKPYLNKKIHIDEKNYNLNDFMELNTISYENQNLSFVTIFYYSIRNTFVN